MSARFHADLAGHARAARLASAWCSLALALVLAVAGRASAQAPVAAGPAPEAPSPIPLVEIAVRADEVTSLLAEIDAASAPTRQVRAIESDLPARRARLQENREDTLRRLDVDPPLALLEGLAANWQAACANLRRSIDTVTGSATSLQRDAEELASLRETWARARNDAAGGQAPPVVLGRIDEIRTAISATKARLEARLAALAVLQHRLSQELTRCDQTLGRIVHARGELFERLVVRNGLPVWRAHLWTGAAGQLADGWRAGVDALDRIARRVTGGQAGRLPLHTALFLALLVLLYRARGLLRRRGASVDGATLGAVFERPISAAVVLAVFTGSLVYYQDPWPFLYLAGLVAVVPVLRLMRPLVDRAAAPGLYVFGALFVFDELRLLIATTPLLEQVAYLIEMLMATLLVTWLRATRRLPTFAGREGASHRTTVFSAALLVAFGTAFVTGALGYMHLARLIGAGALGSSYAALVIAVTVRAFRDLTVHALRARPLRLLRVVQRHRESIERRALGALRWVGTIAWVAASLRAFAILDQVEAFLARLLALSFGWGAVHVSFGDLLAFGVAVWAAFAIARLTRFVLEDDVFPRMRLERGLPLALSSVAQYAIVIVGLSLALVALGVDFTKLTIVLGALGVGVGFGLQSVVSDVAAGLILLIERSVRIGDYVRVGDIEGEVQAIGVRSSTVRTWSGGEVIVPNAELVSHKVTNWTFSDRRSRIEIPVGVAHGTVPDRVSHLLLDVARAHPRVEAIPAPMVLFQSVGESALLFELRCWVADFDVFLVVRSELTAAVYRALDEARIPLAVPQRAVRVTMDERPPSAAEP